MLGKAVKQFRVAVCCKLCLVTTAADGVSFRVLQGAKHPIPYTSLHKHDLFSSVIVMGTFTFTMASNG